MDRSRRTPAPLEEIHVCRLCSSGFVQPCEWVPLEGGRWRVALRCPDCGWEGNGVFGQAAIDRFDEIQDEGVAALTRDLQQLSEQNMSEAVEAFAAALAADQILPEDF